MNTEAISNCRQIYNGTCDKTLNLSPSPVLRGSAYSGNSSCPGADTFVPQNGQTSKPNFLSKCFDGIKNLFKTNKNDDPVLNGKDTISFTGKTLNKKNANKKLVQIENTRQVFKEAGYEDIEASLKQNNITMEEFLELQRAVNFGDFLSSQLGEKTDDLSLASGDEGLLSDYINECQKRAVQTNKLNSKEVYLSQKMEDIKNNKFYKHLENQSSVMNFSGFNDVMKTHGIKVASASDYDYLCQGLLKAGVNEKDLDKLLSHIESKTEGRIPPGDLPNHVLNVLKIKNYMQCDENFYHLNVGLETTYDLVHEVATRSNNGKFEKTMETFCDKLETGEYGLLDDRGKVITRVYPQRLRKTIKDALQSVWFEETLKNSSGIKQTTLGGKTFTLDPSIPVNTKGSYPDLKLKSEMRDLLSAEFFIDDALKVVADNPEILEPNSRLQVLLKKYSYDFNKPFAKQNMSYKALHDIANQASIEYGLNRSYQNAVWGTIKNNPSKKKEAVQILNICDALFKKAQTILSKNSQNKWDVDYSPSKHFILRLMGRDIVCPEDRKNSKLVSFESLMEAVKITHMAVNKGKEVNLLTIPVEFKIENNNVLATAYRKAA